MTEYQPMSNGADQTPVSVAKAIIARTMWEPGEFVLEPAKGIGNFYDNLPSFVHKDWCEITEGRDFFTYWRRPDTIITNPPFQSQKGGRNTLIIPFLEHSLELAWCRVIFLISHKYMPFLTSKRLRRYADVGWALTGQTLFSGIKKWWGLHCLLTFQRDGGWTDTWDNGTYE